MAYKINRLSLLSSTARIQVPWVKVTLKGKTNDFSFGAFTRTTQDQYKGNNGFWYRDVFGVQFPNYVQRLQVTKINGQVNQYVLNINYPITQNDDPNFFEKLFGDVSSTRKIIFTYGDAATPSFVYKEEEAIITTIQQSFNLESSSISYTINAVSGAALGTATCLSFPAWTGKPSAKIKEVFKIYNLGEIFTGMSSQNWDKLIAQDDAPVSVEAKTNISALDYISYLVSCMYDSSSALTKSNPSSIYILTMHDSASYDNEYTYNEQFGEAYGTDKDNKKFEVVGPYFKVSKVSYTLEKSDAYVIDIGYNTSNIVTSFSLENNENYSLYYDYQSELAGKEYVRRLNDKGMWEDVYAPTLVSKNNEYVARASDKTWWTKITQFPINASLTVQGLLMPAKLLTYIRLNVIFPGGHKHISSGLYIITKQVDTIDESGYRTQLALTKVGGDNDQTSTVNKNINSKFYEMN